MLMPRHALLDAGFEDQSPESYAAETVRLRDGREATLWVHRETGHGVLDRELWEEPDFYEQAYRNEYGPELGGPTPPAERFETYRALNRKQFETFREWIEPSTRFLEVGSGAGGILDLAVEAGAAQVDGIEPSSVDADFVRTRTPAARVLSSTLEEAELTAQSYDVIVSLEVLEHTASPRAFLTRCHDLLAPGGKIHIEVPNFDDALLRAYRPGPYADFFYHRAHIHYFTATSLARLCEECGFAGNVTSFAMYPFFNHVWWHQNAVPQGTATTALATPRPGANTAAGQAINAFYARVEAEYEALLEEHMVGDCLIFQGHALGGS